VLPLDKYNDVLQNCTVTKIVSIKTVEHVMKMSVLLMQTPVGVS